MEKFLCRKVLPHKKYNTWLYEKVEFGVIKTNYKNIIFEVIWKLKDGNIFTSMHYLNSLELLPEEVMKQI